VVTPSVQKASSEMIEGELNISEANLITLVDLLETRVLLEQKGFSAENEKSLNKEQLNEILSPVLAKADAMYKEILPQLETSEEWKSLTDERNKRQL
jgi:hypothetical protein